MKNQSAPLAKNAKTAKSQKPPLNQPIKTYPMHYQARLTASMQSLPLSPGTLATVHVQHDSHCPMLREKPICRCCPDIFIENAHGRIEVMPDGSLRHPADLN